MASVGTPIYFVETHSRSQSGSFLGDAFEGILFNKGHPFGTQSGTFMLGCSMVIVGTAIDARWTTIILLIHISLPLVITTRSRVLHIAG